MYATLDKRMLGRKPSLGTIVAGIALISLLLLNFSILFAFLKTQSYIGDIRRTLGDGDLKEGFIRWLTGEHIEELKGILLEETKYS